MRAQSNRNDATPNPRLQRTRSAPLRSPLSRQPLGGTRTGVGTGRLLSAGAKNLHPARDRRSPMQPLDSIKVLFIAGFGPVVREAIPARRLYGASLGISFKEENGGYLHTESLQGAKTFALWPLSQA